ncbi:hypothetical protein [Aestuariivirga sp.]|uniref:hypothetical protein n=1 Tax=Aestuariivirga sp. TaxID=2650926 RepID=UPI003BA92DF7
MPPRELPQQTRPAPQGLVPEDFEDIREAVMETARGRWFLDEFAIRLRTAETSSLVESMKRLETAVASNHDALMARLANALKQDEPEEIHPAPAANEIEVGLRHMKFYRADEDIFEPAPGATLTSVPNFQGRVLMAEEPSAEAPSKRRIVIIRHKPGEQIDVPLADELAKAS